MDFKQFPILFIHIKQIKTNDFFSGIDWARIERKEYNPGYIPGREEEREETVSDSAGGQETAPLRRSQHQSPSRVGVKLDPNGRNTDSARPGGWPEKATGRGLSSLRGRGTDGLCSHVVCLEPSPARALLRAHRGWWSVLENPK